MMAAGPSSSDSGNKFHKTSSSIRNLNQTLDKEDFTDDIWSEICLHLPIKSVFKFRCTSKVWLSLLSEPNFINKWIQINTSSPWILYYSIHRNPVKHTYLDLYSKLFSNHDGFSLNFLNQELIVFGVSNGLVLCSPNLNQKYYYVCNPLTKKWVSLPPPPASASTSSLSALVCDCDCYKVVRIPNFLGESNKFSVEIFSSELGVWNVYQVVCPQVVTWEFSAGSTMIISKGILYWIEGKNKFIAYDINDTDSSSTCKLIDLPGNGEVHISRHSIRGVTFTKIPHRCLGEAEGLVCLAQIDMRKTLSVWVLEGEKWHVLHKDIALRGILDEIEILHCATYENTQIPPNVIRLRLTQVLGFNPLDRNVVIFGTNNYVWAYNIRTGTYEELSHPSFASNKIVPSDNKYKYMYLPFALKPMPTIIPPPSWTSPPMIQVQQKPSVLDL